MCCCNGTTFYLIIIFTYILWSLVNINEGELFLFFTTLNPIQTLGLNLNAFLHIAFFFFSH